MTVSYLRKLVADPTARLALRALLAGAVVFASKFVDGQGNYSSTGLHAALVAGVLAAAEIFTPLNSLVGLFARTHSPAPTPSAPAPAPPVQP